MQRAMTGFASGVMVAASFFSLLLPALDQTADMGKLGFIPESVGFAAGAMVYVVIEELIPEMSEGEHSNIGTICFTLGFILMMALDVGLG